MTSRQGNKGQGTHRERGLVDVQGYKGTSTFRYRVNHKG